MKSEQRLKRFTGVGLVLAIFLFALIVRLIGIGWGLKNEYHNQSFHPDEPLIFDFVHRSHSLRQAGEAEYYNYGTLFYAVLRATEFIGSSVGLPAPTSLDSSEVRSLDEWDYLQDYIAQTELYGRYASAVAGAFTAALLFIILRTVGATTLGAIAGALLILVAPAHVVHSRFQTVDVLSLFFVSLASLFCIRLLRVPESSGRNWNWQVVLAAAFAGMAASTRYSNILLFLPLALAIVFVRGMKGISIVGMAALVSMVAFAATTPGSVTDTARFVDNLRYQMNLTTTGHGLLFVGRPPGWLFHLQQLMVGIGILPVAVGLLGLMHAAYRKKVWAWVLLAFFLPTYVLLASQKTMFLRYEFPLYLALAVGFGYLISGLQRRYATFWPTAAAAALMLIGIESAQSGARGSMLFTRWMAEVDPRDRAGMLLKSLAKGKPELQVGLLADSPWFYTASIIKDASFLRFQPDHVREAYLAGTTEPRVVTFSSGALPRYATYSSFEVEDALRLRGRTDIDISYWGEIQLTCAKIDQLNQEYKVLAVYGAGGPKTHDLQYIRPTIWVLERRQ